MKRSHIIALCLSVAGWLFPVACYAQNQYELSCAAGSSDVEAPTYNPNTQKLRSWVCADATGHVSSPVFASTGGGVTSFNTRTGAVVPAANDYSFSLLSGILDASQVPTNGGLVTTFLNGTGTYTVPAGAVSSVFGRTGAVVATSGDYTVAQVTGAAPLASPTFTGTVTLPAALKLPNTGTIVAPASGTQAIIATATTGSVNSLVIGDNSTGSGDRCTFTDTANDFGGIACVGAAGSQLNIDVGQFGSSGNVGLTVAGNNSTLSITFAGTGGTASINTGGGSSALNVTVGSAGIQISTSGGVQLPLESTTGIRVGTTFAGGHLLLSSTAPTISSGFGSTPSISSNNGTASFRVNVGTGGAATSGVIGLPTASSGWNVKCDDITTTSATVFVTKQTASTTTTATIGNFTTAGAAGAWAASDILACQASAF